MTTPRQTQVPEGADVWTIAVSDVLGERDFALLDADERSRVRRYATSLHGAWFGGGRAAAKRLLAGYLGVPAAEVSIGRVACPRCGNAAHGPPTVARPTTCLHISASRADEMAVLAISARPVGVDVESREPRRDISALVRRSLTAQESAFVLSAAGSAAQQAAFLRCWTRKEAVVKAAGIGIATALRDIETHPSETGPTTVAGPADLPASCWQVSSVEHAGFFVAVASAAGHRPDDDERLCAVDDPVRQGEFGGIQR